MAWRNARPRLPLPIRKASRRRRSWRLDQGRIFISNRWCDDLVCDRMCTKKGGRGRGIFFFFFFFFFFGLGRDVGQSPRFPFAFSPLADQARNATRACSQFPPLPPIGSSPATTERVKCGGGRFIRIAFFFSVERISAHKLASRITPEPQDSLPPIQWADGES